MRRLRTPNRRRNFVLAFGKAIAFLYLSHGFLSIKLLFQVARNQFLGVRYKAPQKLKELYQRKKKGSTSAVACVRFETLHWHTGILTTRATTEVNHIFFLNTTPHFRSLRRVLLNPITDLEKSKLLPYRMKNPMALRYTFPENHEKKHEIISEPFLG